MCVRGGCQNRRAGACASRRRRRRSCAGRCWRACAARAQMAADALRLAGVARLRALMHAEYADLVVVEAEALPDLSPGSDLYQQVAAQNLELRCTTLPGWGLPSSNL